jgi:hypothetical protein
LLADLAEIDKRLSFGHRSPKELPNRGVACGQAPPPRHRTLVAIGGSIADRPRRG